MALSTVYRDSLALLTDLYQLTMAYGYWKLGMADQEAVFQLAYRKNPFGNGFGVACGLAEVVEYLERFRFRDDDLAYLATLKGNDDKPLFDKGFIDYLGDVQFACDVHAVPEGTVVFPYEPLVRVTGPIIQAQLLETALLNLVNFQTLIATKAARVCWAAKGEAVLEFGLRRAQGVDGGVSASRAAFVGGCAATSNVLAGKLFGIPVKGTHAHSWVMAFDAEPEAFEAYARVLPNNCVFLVDTYDTLQGVRHAIEVGRKLRETGHRMVGIRLDSGDLAYLSIEARKLLDAAGFQDAAILASNELDETIIASLKQQGATINVWGVGTRLATGGDQPALGGVYKLGALRDLKTGQWEYKMKLSETAAKASTPGVLQVRRFRADGTFVADAIYAEHLAPKGDGELTIVDPLDVTRRKTIPPGTAHEDLLVPIFRRGTKVYDVPPTTAARERALSQMAMLHPTTRRTVNPHQYPAGFELGLNELKTELLLRAREKGAAVPK